MKTLKIIIILTIILSCLSSFAQIKVLSTGKVSVGGGTTNNFARFNISDTNNNTIYSKGFFTFGWGDAIKSQVDRTDAIAFSAYYNDNRNFMVFGNGDIWGNGTHITGSDSKLKYDIKKLENATEKLKMLQGVTYKKKIDRADKPIQHIGFIAQDIEKILPDIVYTDDNGIKGIAYEEIIPLLVEAIKDQQIRIATLTQQIEGCCSNNAKLKSASITGEINNDLNDNLAQLNQNNPNPFSSETNISCFIPALAETSVLYIYNMNGVQLRQFNLNGKGNQSITIDGRSFEPGMYLYTLVIDGKEIDTKRMILTK